ncbi:hypothetical protein DPMN_147787 [Dreissena polymorpha]|uniref:Uncharacterized protein n=1 Tax=Dreissena polymorpha TaxID=45954 RepID=A0A9D4IZM1_DREPO|nr:hypothetical protein DPMN_147787 [Dreissena polymorpha]
MFYYSHIMKNAPPSGCHFHEDRTINVASRVLTMKNAPPPGDHNSSKISLGQNPLTKFHDDWTINAASRVLTIHIKKNAPPTVGDVFQPTGTIFKLVQDIIGTNLLTKFLMIGQ